MKQLPSQQNNNDLETKTLKKKTYCCFSQKNAKSSKEKKQMVFFNYWD